MMVEKKNENPETPGSDDRRKFLQSLAIFGGCVLISGVAGNAIGTEVKAQVLGRKRRGPFEYTRDNPENIIYSTCLSCSQNCAVKCKINDGILVKLDGNAFSPRNKLPNLDYNETLEEAARIDGVLCSMGQAGIGIQYNPNRVKQVLKRKPGTPRGGGEWVSINFNQAIDEIVEGGDLFREGQVKGLKDVYGLTNRETAGILAGDVEKIRSGELDVDSFKSRHAMHLDSLIDPDHPDLGPVNNRFVFLSGNVNSGRRRFINWFTRESFGSANLFEDSSLTGNRREMAWRNAGQQWIDGNWHDNVNELNPDYSKAEYAVFFGEGFSDPDFVPPAVSGQIANSIVQRDLKVNIVSTEMPKSASRFVNWIQINPGSEGSFALGMLNWIIVNERFDRSFLECANNASAQVEGYSAFVAASYLVKIEDGRPARFLHAEEIGIGSDLEFVVMRNGSPIAVDPNGSVNPVKGDLDARFESDNLVARTAFSLLKDRVQEKTIDEYAETCGVRAEDIAGVAEEFSTHGIHSVAEINEVQATHANDFTIEQSVVTLNLLAGNHKSDGTLTATPSRRHDGESGSSTLGYLNYQHPSGFPAFGLTCNREGSRYENSTLFEGYPARRQWYPCSHSLYHEVIPSVADEYPYKASVLFLHQPASLLSLPDSDNQVNILRDTSKIPLVVACGSEINDATNSADYLFPDTKSWESWGIDESGQTSTGSDAIICQPALEPQVETVIVEGTAMPVNLEAVLIALGKKLNMPGFGPDAFGTDTGFHHQDDWYMKAVLQAAAGNSETGPVRDADPEELAVYLSARAHLPQSVFDPERMVNSTDENLWNKTVYILNRGGRFDNASDSGVHFTGALHLFYENVAECINPLSGDHFDGLPG